MTCTAGSSMSSRVACLCSACRRSLSTRVQIASRARPSERVTADWWQHAACRGQDPTPWFADGSSVERAEWRTRKVQLQRHAKMVCRACPVAADCLAHAVEQREPFGIWGGLTEVERLPLLEAADVLGGDV